MKKIMWFALCLVTLLPLQGCVVHPPYISGPSVSLGYGYPSYGYRPGWNGGYGGWRGGYGGHGWGGSHGWGGGGHHGWGGGWKGHH